MQRRLVGEVGCIAEYHRLDRAPEMVYLKIKRRRQKSSKMKTFDRKQDNTRLKHRIGEVNQTRNNVPGRQAGRRCGENLN